MDLGVTYTDDFASSASILSPEEIAALLGPMDINVPTHPSAIQVLLNQGAEALSQKPTSVLDRICPVWLAHLNTQNHKIVAITRTQNPPVLGSLPLVCPFKTEKHIGLIAFDWTTAYLLIDGMLGGVNGLSIEKKPDQPYSSIEQTLLEPVLHRLLSALSHELGSSLTPLPLATSLPIASAKATRLMFTVRTSVSVGKIMLELPENFIPEEAPAFLFENPSDLLAHLSFETTAVAQTAPTTLKQVQSWTIGTTLPLTLTQLACGPTSLATGRVSTKNSTHTFTVQGDR